MVALFGKALLGAATVLLVAVLSKTRNFYSAGLVPLFPTFALIAHAIVGAERSRADLQTTALFGLFSLLPYAAYLAVVYVASICLSVAATLALATLVWGVAAPVLIVVWLRFQPG